MFDWLREVIHNLKVKQLVTAVWTSRSNKWKLCRELLSAKSQLDFIGLISRSNAIDLLFNVAL